jgi:hypothetical protein
MLIRRLAACLLLAGCAAEAEPVDPTPGPPVGNGPTADFDRFCGDTWWEDTKERADADPLAGNYGGAFELSLGSLETMKLMPEHPFAVDDIRIKFIGNPGPVRIRLSRALGRSYPGADEADDLMPPIEATVDAPDPREYTRFDVSDQRIFLLPNQHYVLSAERMDGGPAVAIETVPPDESSRALMLVPGEFIPWGSDMNFRMKLRGDSFCRWADDGRWFAPALQTFEGTAPHVTDVNGDDHEDLVMSSGGRPHVWLGDGLGAFTEAPDAFPPNVHAAASFFADLDNDGDVDAFGPNWTKADGDGDGHDKFADCDDTDAAVHPEAEETPDNGVDDDCDGTVDDGTSTEDRDEDGVTVADGDCNDSRDDVFPGADELSDGLDNDCDGRIDDGWENHVWLNDGTGNFERLEGTGVERWDAASCAGIGDGNSDGNLDLYYGNWLKNYPSDPADPDEYFEGVGDGTFTRRFDEAGLQISPAYSCYGVLWNDYNDDGLQDIYVGNYHLYPNQLWQNQGDGTFVDVAEAVGAAFDDIPSGHRILTGGHSYGGDFGDVDNDGDMDLFVANLAHPREQPWSDPSMFLINSGPPDFTFENVFAERGFQYDEGDLNATFADFDNDMDLDIVVTSVYRHHYSRLYMNDGDGSFTDVTYEAGLQEHDVASLAWADFDEDGDLDIVIKNRLLINRVGQDNHWIVLDLEGTTSNRDALGARVWLTAGGVTQIRDVRGPGGHVNAQSTRLVHFGLAQETVIDSLVVRWVGGETETIEGALINRRMRIVEGSGAAVP